MQFNLCFVWKAEMEWNCETDEGWVANFKEHGQQRGKARRRHSLARDSKAARWTAVVARRKTYEFVRMRPATWVFACRSVRPSSGFKAKNEQICYYT